MKKWESCLCLCLLLLILHSCNNTAPVKLPANYRDSFFYYLYKGDRTYAKKATYKSFEESLKYYDKAEEIADKTNDTLLLAEAVFAMGRVYDGWNKEPQNTIKYFKQAVYLFNFVPGAYKRYLYAKHLVAHAYDKINDSLNTVVVLKELYNEILLLDTSVKKQLPFTAEMALISTEVHNYSLAEEILKNLTKRLWIKNDTITYEYLNHYYLTQSRLDVYYKHLTHSLYLDSFNQVFDNSKNIIDRMYFSINLAELYAAQKNYSKGYEMLNMNRNYSDSLNNLAGLNSMESRLLKSELQAEKRRLEFQSALRNTWLKLIWLLTFLLLIITILTIYLQKRKRKYEVLSKQLSEANKMLDEKVHQVELLNKEIQHRIKNNLQMVFSLLQMQERRSQHNETSANLLTAMIRIESIASLHNELVNSNGNPDFTKHIKNLVSAAVTCLAGDKKVITHISAEELKIPSTFHVPISLILNEWITNSIKYAQTKNDLLELTISVKKENKYFILLYSDNGVVQQKQPEGLGTEIINMLCRQISCNLLTVFNNPYNYQLTIPCEQ